MRCYENWKEPLVLEGQNTIWELRTRSLEVEWWWIYYRKRGLFDQSLEQTRCLSSNLGDCMPTISMFTPIILYKKPFKSVIGCYLASLVWPCHLCPMFWEGILASVRGGPHQSTILEQFIGKKARFPRSILRFYTLRTPYLLPSLRGCRVHWLDGSLLSAGHDA